MNGKYNSSECETIAREIARDSFSDKEFPTAFEKVIWLSLVPRVVPHPSKGTLNKALVFVTWCGWHEECRRWSEDGLILGMS